jgi:4-amino-4-deoxy-L-arabinose transferase-like glycosyltransferase
MGVFVSGTVYPTTLLAFLLALAVLCLVPGKGGRAGLLAVSASGFIFGVATLAKPIVAAAIVTVAAWLFVLYRGRRLLTVGLFLFTAILALTPWTVRNYEVFGKFVPIEARGIDQVAPWAKTPDQIAQEVLIEQAILAKLKQEKKLGNPDGGPVYQALAEKLKEAAENPEPEDTPTLALPLPEGVNGKRLPEMIKGMALRFPGEFLSFFELYPRRVGFLKQQQRDLARAWKNPRLVEEIPFGNSLVNAVSAFAVSFLYIFALLGIRAMWLTRSAREYLALYLGMVLSFAAGYALSWGKIRYRVPVDPYIILLSAWGVFWAWGAIFGVKEAADAGPRDAVGQATAN